MSEKDIPFRMFTSDVLALAKFGAGTLAKRRREGSFPEPIDRGREDIYFGPAVYRALGFIDAERPQDSDPIMDALKSIQPVKAAR